MSDVEEIKEGRDGAGQGSLGLEGWQGAVVLREACACSADTASASEKPLYPHLPQPPRSACQAPDLSIRSVLEFSWGSLLRVLVGVWHF